MIPGLLGEEDVRATSSRGTGRTSARCGPFSRPISPWPSRCRRSTSSTHDARLHDVRLPSLLQAQQVRDRQRDRGGRVHRDRLELKRCLFGIRSFVGEGSDFEDVIMMGADYYESPSRSARTPRAGPNPGVGRAAASGARSSTRTRGSGTAWEADRGRQGRRALRGRRGRDPRRRPGGAEGRPHPAGHRGLGRGAPRQEAGAKGAISWSASGSASSSLA